MSLLTLAGISKTFSYSKGFFSSFKGTVKALDKVSLELEESTIIGLVGESGSGKTTLGRIIAKLLLPDEGSFTIDGINAADIPRNDYSRIVQMIFQDPFSSLNPRLSVRTILTEASDNPDRKAAEREVLETLDSVGLSAKFLSNYPHQFSGGQRQRIALARALMKKPKFIVADEPLSSLDVSIGNQLLKLFSDLKVSSKTSFIFISHDITAAASISDRMIVLKEGRIVESGLPLSIISSPREDYTKRLIAAVPVI